jgi:alpha-1,2-mannosyltransferase
MPVMTIRIERPAVPRPPLPGRVLLSRVLLIAPSLAVALYFLLSYSPHGVGFSPYRIDLDVYRIGSQVWLHRGNLYGVIPATRGGARLPFSYPPIAAVLLSPLALIPMAAAVCLLTLVTIIMTALVLRVFLLSAGRARAGMARRAAAETGAARWPTRWRAVAWVLPAALLLEPVRNTLLYGQVNVILMAFVSADCLGRSPRWPRGALTGVAAAVKLTPAAFVLFFVLRRDWRAAVTAALSFLACTGAGFLFAWHDSVEYWTSVIFQDGRPGSAVYAANQSITGAIARAGLDPRSLAGAALWMALSAAVVVLACLGMRRALAASQQAWALSLNALAGLLISPISWSHHWGWGEMAVLTLAVVCWPGRGGSGRPDSVTSAHERRGLLLAAVGTLMFALSPQWLLPNGGNRELHWAAWQQVLGSSYVIYAVVALLGTAFRIPDPPCLGRVLHDGRDLVGAVKDAGLRLVEAQDGPEWRGRGGQPVADVGRLPVLDHDGDGPISVAVQTRGAVANGVAADRVGDEVEAGQVVHGDGPEGVDRRIGVEPDGVAAAPVELAAVGVGVSHRVGGLVAVVAP